MVDVTYEDVETGSSDLNLVHSVAAVYWIF